MSFRKVHYLIIGVAIITIGCIGSEYDRLKSRELARNVRYDSLFLGIKFGMTRKDFFAHCWDLNKKGILSQGPGNLSVQYKLDSTNLKSSAYLWFYPEFEDDKIVKMPMKITYQAWAPWNQPLSSDSLLLDVKKMMVKWYGGEFIHVKNNKDDRSVWVKIDGNRRIRLFIDNISTVRVDITDLIELERSKKEEKEN